MSLYLRDSCTNLSIKPAYLYEVAAPELLTISLKLKFVAVLIRRRGQEAPVLYWLWCADADVQEYE